MAFWTEVHWHEGMFLRPHHLQTAQRQIETVVRSTLEAVRAFAWGFTELQIAPEPLENFTLRLDRCSLRMKDSTWVRVPDNTEVAPVNFEAALGAGGGAAEIFLGIPYMQDVRANTVPLENPEKITGLPRYEPHPVTRRDENTGENPQTLYIRRIRGKLFVAGQDMTGYESVRLCRVKRTDRPGAVPELDELGAGPLLALQASASLSALVTSLADQVEAKDEVLAREAHEHRMLFTDGVAANSEHLLKLHALNEGRAELRAIMQCPVLHPYDVFVALAKLVGHLSIFHEEMVPGPIPDYDHDRPGESLDRIRRKVLERLDAIRPPRYTERAFVRKKDELGRDGLEVELDRAWIDENLDLYVGLHAEGKDDEEVYKHVYATLDMKLASPKRGPRIHNIAVRGLGLQRKAPPAGTLPRRTEVHYFRVDKAIASDRTDYWKECEQERGIRMSIREGQLAVMEQYRPTLYVVLKGPAR